MFVIRSRKLQSLVFLVCCMFALGTVAHADNSVVFNFNGIALSANGTYSYANGQNGTYMGNESTVSNTLNTQFQTAPSGVGTNNKLTVSGTTSTGGTNTSVAATNNWLGDGHVVNGLAGSLGAGGNTYLINANGQESFTGTDTGFVFDFQNAAGTAQDNFITSVTFTFEIFPDGTCSSLPCASVPDFEFYAGTSMSAIQNASNLIYTKNGCTPGASGCAVTSTNSPTSNGGVEVAPQLGPTTVTFYFSTPVSVLDFEDWPQTIGVNNLQINTPEPGSLLLLAIGLTGLAAIRRRYATM